MQWIVTRHGYLHTRLFFLLSLTTRLSLLIPLSAFSFFPFSFFFFSFKKRQENTPVVSFLYMLSPVFSSPSFRSRARCRLLFQRLLFLFFFLLFSFLSFCRNSQVQLGNPALYRPPSDQIRGSSSNNSWSVCWYLGCSRGVVARAGPSLHRGPVVIAS